jgi:hypothetical protein
MTQLPLVFPVGLIIGGLVLLALLWRFADLRGLRRTSSPLDDLASTLDQVRERVNGGEKIPPTTAQRLRAALTSLSEALGE